MVFKSLGAEFLALHKHLPQYPNIQILKCILLGITMWVCLRHHKLNMFLNELLTSTLILFSPGPISIHGIAFIWLLKLEPAHQFWVFLLIYCPHSILQFNAIKKGWFYPLEYIFHLFMSFQLYRHHCIRKRHHLLPRLLPSLWTRQPTFSLCSK